MKRVLICVLGIWSMMPSLRAQSYATLTDEEIVRDSLNVYDEHSKNFDRKKAIALYEELLRRHPSGIIKGGPRLEFGIHSIGDWDFVDHLAYLLYEEKGQYDKAVKFWKRGIKICDKEKIEFYHWEELSKACEKSGRLKEAVKYGLYDAFSNIVTYTEAEILWPQYGDYDADRARALARLMTLSDRIGQTDHAIVYAHMAVSYVFRSSEKMSGINGMSKQEAVDSLLSIFRFLNAQCTKIPASRNGELFIGSYFDKAMEYTDSLPDYQKTSRRYDIYVEQARCIIDEWRFDSVASSGEVILDAYPLAKNYCEKAIALVPYRVEARDVLGMAYMRRGKEYYGEALKVWEEMKAPLWKPVGVEIKKDLLQTELYKELRRRKLIKKL